MLAKYLHDCVLYQKDSPVRAWCSDITDAKVAKTLFLKLPKWIWTYLATL